MNEDITKEGTKISNEPIVKKKCNNQMLQYIQGLKNLGENYDDFVDFEKHFTNWDYDLIILDELRFVTDMEDKEDNYSFLETLGIYNNIGMFARKLQGLLGEFHGKGFTYSVIMLGDNLNIDINDVSTDEILTRKHYVAKCGKLNQIKGSFGNDGYKL